MMFKYIYQGKFNGIGIVLPVKKQKQKTTKQLMAGLRPMKDLYGEPERCFLCLGKNEQETLYLNWTVDTYTEIYTCALMFVVYKYINLEGYVTMVNWNLLLSNSIMRK